MRPPEAEGSREVLSTPLATVKAWRREEADAAGSVLAVAGCLSTIGEDGCPSARFVDVKEIAVDALVITGSMSSRKGRELAERPRAALTFWWHNTRRQVRIRGSVDLLPRDRAAELFRQRSRSAQLASHACSTGIEVPDAGAVRELVRAAEERLRGREIPVPDGWGGLTLHPTHVELLEFRDDRLHVRRLFTRTGGSWASTVLQP